METMEKFTGLYSVSKTLRFELIPQGKTRENMEKGNILRTDEELDISYKKMKKTLDEFHKDFIERSLSAFVPDKDFSDSLMTYGNLFSSHSSDKKRIDELRAKMRKEIVKHFKKMDDFTLLNKKELVKERIKSWMDENNPALYYDKQFEQFTTYFTGYNENRMNMYSDEEKATAVAHRLIDENLATFIDNMAIYAKVASSAVSEHFDETVRNCCTDEGIRISDFFSLDSYCRFMTQKGIETYNVLIGGIKEENRKVQGLNEYINLYNQQNPNAKLPVFKMLYKQILSDRISASWLPDEFISEKEVLESIKEFYEQMDIYESLEKVLDDLKTSDWEHVYIRNDTSITGISMALFNNYAVISNALEAMGKKENGKADYLSIYEIQEALNQYAKVYGEDNNIKNDCIAAYFPDRYYNGEMRVRLEKAYSDFNIVYTAGIGGEYTFSQEDKEKLKTLLDLIMELLHLVKPLYMQNSELEKDEEFYGEFGVVYDRLEPIVKLYDKVRNFATRKPYTTEKIKLNFGCSTLMDGWDQNKEEQNHGILLEKEGNYYLGIMSKEGSKAFSKLPECTDAKCYRKMVYKLLPGPNKMLPKVFFSKSRIAEFAPSPEIMQIYKNGTFKKGEGFSLSDCHKLIDFFKVSVEKEWGMFGFKFSETESYNDISEFYREVSEQGYKISFVQVAESYIDKLVNDGKLFLFKIYNKDFSSYSKGKPNLHTMYWKALFDERNLSDVVYKLNGEAEMFYRKKSEIKNNTVHPANVPLESKNPERRKQSVFSYDLIKDRRYTVDKFMLHVPITMNFKASGGVKLNEIVCDYIRNNPDVHIIGIDRGERNLLYISVIDRNGNVIQDENGKYLMYSLNDIRGEYTGGSFVTPYQSILEKREKERDEARKSWNTIEGIKDLKSGYMSQVVHLIAELMVKYNAIVVLEDLNGGFKNSRKKVERQVYQNFEKALIDKLNYLVFKNRENDEAGGLYKALQLTEKFESFQKLTKQTGFIFYVPAWNTSKIDPVTGFVDTLKPKYTNMEDARKLFSEKMEAVRYNGEWDCFEFTYTDEYRDRWTVCTAGGFRYAYDSRANNNKGDYVKWDVNGNLKELFTHYGIDYHGGDLRESICRVGDKDFFLKLIKNLQVTLALRYSSAKDGKDFILSPVADENGEFYCSEGRNDGLPQDADANGAFNIARKGLCVLRQIDQAENYKDWTTKIRNEEWLRFVRSELRK